MSSWLDITRPLDDTLAPWPGRARPRHRWDRRLAAGDHCNVSFWEISAHAGTHMDAPLHFVEGGQAIDQIPPDVFIGACRVVELAAPLDEPAARRYAGVQRLLIKTAHSQSSSEAGYADHEALLTEPAAALLLDRGLRLIGTDRLSVDDSRGRSFRLHQMILGAGCVIVEGLLLAGAREGDYTLSAAPLRLTGTEASPIRALLKEEPPA